MKRILVVCLVLGLFLSGIVMAEDEVYTIMRPDRQTRLEWLESYNRAPKAPIYPEISPPRAELSLLDHLNYIPSERNQGYCGNCWAWAGTGCMAITLDVQNGIFDRLSVQLINSCEYEVIGKICCMGGWLADVVDFYQEVGYAVPWTNENAHWQDGDASCDTPCDSISAEPSYPIGSIQELRINTFEVGADTAIANIKNVLAQNKAIWFAFYLPSDNDWGTFVDFWINGDEESVWNPDYSCGHTWSNGGAHAVLCVGYNDEPGNRYWIMLNSWGSSTGRPNGLFRMAMDIDYDCFYVDNNQNYYSFYWQTLDMNYDVVTPTPTPVYEEGDACSTAVDASAGGVFSGSTVNYHNFYNPSDMNDWPYSWGMDGPDYVFRIDIDNPQGWDNLQAKVISATFDNALYVISDCSDPSGSILTETLKDEYSDNTGEQINWSMQEAGTIYLVVDSYNPSVCGSFDIQINIPTLPCPTPTDTPTPTPSPTATPITDLMAEEHTYTFDSGNEQWQILSFPGIYDEPDVMEQNGMIGFSAAGSTNCFGSWQSPYHTFTIGEKYRAKFRVITNQLDPSLVPSFRIRVQDKNSQGISSLMVNSLGEGDYSPIASGKVYEVIYQPPASAVDDGYCFCFDLINLGDSNDANAKILLDMVEIKKVTVR